jgi:hypothetical protein
MSKKVNASTKTKKNSNISKSSIFRSEYIEDEIIYNEPNTDDDRKPSTVRKDEWIWAKRKTGSYKEDTKNCGKWLIFLTSAQVDKVWKLVKESVENGKLGNIAKVSTLYKTLGSRPNRHVICVYTYNWKDENDVRLIRLALKRIGITWKISYKSDTDTELGKYEITGYKKIAKYQE